MIPDPEFYLEPIRFLYDPGLFSGIGTRMPPNAEVVTSLETANSLAFSQHVPDDFVIWTDFCDDIARRLRADPAFDQAQAIVGTEALNLQKAHLPRFKEFRWKLVRKTASDLDKFRFSDASDDAHHMLSLISVGRLIFGLENLDILERIYEIYRRGGWPCGIRKDGRTMMVFDPSVLMDEGRGT
ncbi:hypothetical protein [Inquilinus limosus]|uniref:hypothetical protein n=1 Tax=Inquilinus limosus TaxID=171674 RepID=UPI000409DD54|nr:hypothetical protein [Inquilinus limosus]